MISHTGDPPNSAPPDLLAVRGVLCLFPDQKTLDRYLLLGILNSKTFWMFIRHRAPTMGRGQHVYRAAVLKTVPFPVGESKDAHEKITELAKQMTNDPLDSHERRILLPEIDKLVRALYRVISRNERGDLISKRFVQ